MQKTLSSEFLTREERTMLLERSDLKSLWAIFMHWFWIGLAFALAYFFPNPLTIIVSLFIIGGKQLACAILMHDASHFSILKNKKWNDIVGQWLGAYPIFNNVLDYRPYHKTHHLFNGLEEDPDLFLTRGYPTTKKSMGRKFFRDLTGQTGVKAFLGLMLMKLGYLEYNLGNKVIKVSQKDRTWKAFFIRLHKEFTNPAIANIVLFLLLYAFASGWLYLLWFGAYLTTFQFCLRIRSIAEHSIVEDSENPILNTRTTYANFLERMLFAPFNVNYHVEHHLSLIHI